MRFLSIAVAAIPGGPGSSSLSPSARTQAERERALRAALFFSCAIGLVTVRLFAALYEAAPIRSPVEVFLPDGPEVITDPDPARLTDPRPVDNGLPVAAELDSIPPVTEPSEGGGESISGVPPGPGAASTQGNPVPGTEQGPMEPDTYLYYDEPPVEATRVIPEYPEVARQARMEGTVLLQVHVGTDGRVHDVRIMRSAGVFDGAAEEAVRRWRFRPALANGRPVAVWVAIPIRFTLH
jgi:protein TonB